MTGKKTFIGRFYEVFHRFEDGRPGVKRDKKSAARTIGMGSLLLTLICGVGIISTGLVGQSQSAVAGTVEANLNVGAQGAASYSIPIKVAPGVQNLHPELSFQYNSGSTASGIMGVGWNVSGFSTISRCGKKRYLDGVKTGVNMDDNDRLCKDGVRLLGVAGYTNYWNKSSYHPEIEDWTKVIPQGSCGEDACSYRVERKDGRILYYGRTTDGRVTGGVNGRIHTWMLSRVEDKNGNEMDITYQNENSIARPILIEYGKRRVEFFYEPRSGAQDQVKGFVAGGSYELNHRLRQVVLKVGNERFKNYNLRYDVSRSSGRSRLNSISECDGQGRCLEPTMIQWNDRTENARFRVVTPAGNVYQSHLKAEAGVNIIPGDFNGDGKTDFIRQEKGGFDNDLHLSFSVYMSNGDGNFTIVAPQGEQYQKDLRFDPGVNIIPGDFNGDGKTDFLRQTKGSLDATNSSNNFRVYLSLGNGHFNVVTPPGGRFQGLLSFEAGVNIIPGDFDGDGKTDFIRQEKNSFDDDINNSFNIYFSNGNGHFRVVIPAGYEYQKDLRFDPGAVIIPGDFNGDGKTDFLRQTKGPNTGNNFNVYLSLGNGYFNIITPPGARFQGHLNFDAGVNIIPGDFNGDGKMDFIRQEKNGFDNDINNSFNVYFSKGDGLFDIVTPSGNRYQNDLRFDPGAIIIPGDFNGDGKTDFIRQERNGLDDDVNNSFNIYYSKGDGHFHIITPSGTEYQDHLRFDPGANIILGDYDGDGLTDFIRQEKGEAEKDNRNTFNVYFNAQSSTTQISDRVASILEGQGLIHELTYKPMNQVYDTEYFSPGSGNLEFRGAMWVVSNYVKRDQATGDRFQLSYRYSRSVLNREGQGFLGFGKVTVDSVEEGLRRVSEYHTDFPLQGRIKNMKTQRLVGNLLLQEERYTWRAEHGFLGARSKQINMTDKESITHYGSGTLSKVTRNHFDAYGNLYFMEDFDNNLTRPIYTCASYENLPNNWTLGRLQELQTNASCTNQGQGNCTCDGTIFKKTAFAYDVKGNMTERSRWDSANNIWLSETYAYNSQGNQVRKTLPTGSVTEVEYETKYHTFPRRIIEDAGGKRFITTLQFNSKFGEQIHSTNPNGLVTEQQLDFFGRLKEIHRQKSSGELLNTLDVAYYRRDGLLVVENRQALDWNGTSITKSQTMDNFGRLLQKKQSSSDGLNILQDTEWNKAGRISRESEPYLLGDTPLWTKYLYDSTGNRTRATHPNGSVANYAYTVTGGCGLSRLQTRIVLNNSPHRVNCTDSRNKTVKEVYINNPGNMGRFYTLDVAGRLLKVENVGGKSSTSFEYDSLGRKIASVTPHGGRETYGYNGGGVMESITHVDSGDVTRLEYDNLGRVVRKIYNDGSVTLLGYDSFSSGKGELTSLETKDAKGNRIALREFGYNTQGETQVMTLTTPEGNWSMKYTYRPDGELDSVTFPDGSVKRREYYPSGLLHKVKLDNKEYVTYANYNAVGQPERVNYLNGSRSVYAYDGNRRLQHIETYGKNAAGAERKMQDQTYAWTKFNEVSSITDNIQSSHTRTFTYNLLGYLTQATGIFGTLNYEYDLGGNMLKKEGVDFTYSGDRLTGTSDNRQFTYNKYGHRQTKIAAENQWAYQYSASRRLREVKKNGTLVSSYQYDGMNRRVKKTDADGTVSIYVADDYEITLPVKGGELHTRYVEGTAGRIAAVTSQVNSNAALFQHTQYALRAGIYNTASLSGLAASMNNSLMLFVSQPGGIAALSLKYPLLLALGLTLVGLFMWMFVRSARTESLTGKLRAKLAYQLEELGLLGAERAEAWAAAAGTEFAQNHRKLALPIPTLVFTLMAFLVLNCQGDNPGKSGYVIGGLFSVQTLSNGLSLGELNRNLLPGGNGAGYPVVGDYFFHHDHVGSTSLITDARGVEVSRAVYKPFGELYHEASPGLDLFRAKFTGKEFDKDTDLYYFNARYYDPTVGRFAQADTQVFGSTGRLASDLNRYAYGANNPVLYTDPSGNFIHAIIAFFAGLGGGIAAGVSAAAGAAAAAAAAIAGAISATTIAIGVGIGALVSVVSYSISAGDSFNAGGFFAALGIGALLGGLGALTGGGGFAVLNTFVFTSGTAAASVAAGAVSGLVAGAITGFTGAVLTQVAEFGYVKDWAKVGIDMGIGAAVGLFMGGLQGAGKFFSRNRKDYMQGNRTSENIARNTSTVSSSGAAGGRSLPNGVSRAKAWFQASRPAQGLHQFAGRLKDNGFHRPKFMKNLAKFSRGGTSAENDSTRALSGSIPIWNRIKTEIQQSGFDFGSGIVTTGVDLGAFGEE